jgi:protein-disulfide isomerase
MNSLKLKCHLLGLLLMSLGSALVIASAHAEVCVAPTSQKKAEVAAYVMKRYHIGSAPELTLADDAQEGGCFWKLHYTTASPKRDITLYLSPDAEHLAVSLYDLRIDPLAEEKAVSDALLTALLAGGPPSIGSATAPVTIVEFSDFECPFCKKMTDVLEKEVLPAQGKNVRLVFRNFPLAMHPWAKPAAQIAECAALQSSPAFWKTHDYLFENQSKLDKDNVTARLTSFIESQGGIDKKQFESCVERDLAAGPVAQDMDLGQKNGVRATPTIFVNGTRFEGAKDAAQLNALIKDAMAAGPVSAGPDVVSAKAGRQ